MSPVEAQRLANELVESVMCDGFDGYFFNSPDDPSQAIQALELIGASESAAIVRRACSRFPDGMPPAERFARQDVLLDVVQAADRDVFEEEDSAWFAYPEDIAALAAAYVSAHSS